MNDALEASGEADVDELADQDGTDSAGVMTSAAHIEMHAFHRGPLPTPEDFARYDQILPGTAERILSLVESTVEHQRRMDVRNLDLVERLAERFLSAALAIGLAVVAAALTVAILLVISGEALLGAGIAVADIVAAAIGLTRMMRRRPDPTTGEEENRD